MNPRTRVCVCVCNMFVRAWVCAWCERVSACTCANVVARTCVRVHVCGHGLSALLRPLSLSQWKPRQEFHSPSLQRSCRLLGLETAAGGTAVTAFVALLETACLGTRICPLLILVQCRCDTLVFLVLSRPHPRSTSSYALSLA